ncbi:MAG: hypothetical protein GC200_08555 [Tepidisphaera sp.]|nr:hypothetical protein [Tepidisphaera sp.]
MFTLCRQLLAILASIAALAAPLLAVRAASAQPVTLACLWDEDTLAYETKKFPGLADVITGRFERNPDEYYRLRLSRVTAQIDKTPSELSLYDDAAVACDRLHNDADAITWMDRKRAAMSALPAAAQDTPETREHWYRYHANLGTFYVHQWLRSGANHADIDALRRSDAELVEALTLNPDAHFGRERYQLGAVRWLIALATDPDHTDATLYDFIADGHAGDLWPGRPPRDGPSPKLDPADAVRGFSGLIVLGDAWQSVDVYWALRQALVADGDQPTAYLAELRANELLAAGRKSLAPTFLISHTVGRGAALEVSDANKLIARDYFARARVAADQWCVNRLTYMALPLASGDHPDTNPNFWQDWTDNPPAPPVPDYSEKALSRAMLGAGVGLLVILSGIAVVVWIVVRNLRR